MRSLAITGVALAALLAPAAAFADSDSAAGAPPVVTSAKAPPMLPPAAARAQGAPRLGMPITGPQAPGPYHQPYYGYALPQYWIAPNYFLPNYGAYGLAAPAQGFGWSRYYDDAVLTDRWGRVYDWRGNIAWDRDSRWQGSYDDFGYRDDRISQGSSTPRGKRPRGYGRDARLNSFNNYTYDGRWTGSWNGGPVQTYEGRFDGNVRPHWQMDHGYQGSYQSGPHLEYGAGYGYSFAGPSTVTVIVQASAPIVTRTVSYRTEYIRVAAPRRAAVVRKWKPRAKPVPRCVC